MMCVVLGRHARILSVETGTVTDQIGQRDLKDERLGVKLLWESSSQIILRSTLGCGPVPIARSEGVAESICSCASKKVGLPQTADRRSAWLVATRIYSIVPARPCTYRVPLLGSDHRHAPQVRPFFGPHRSLPGILSGS
jgi:hypothetical protein